MAVVAEFPIDKTVVELVALVFLTRNEFTAVVAFEFANVENIPPRLIAFAMVADPPRVKEPAAPIPPETINAPLVVRVESVVLVTETVPFDVNPVKVPTAVIWVWDALTDNVAPVLVKPVPAVR